MILEQLLEGLHCSSLMQPPHSKPPSCVVEVLSHESLAADVREFFMRPSAMTSALHASSWEIQTAGQVKHASETLLKHFEIIGGAGPWGT